MFNYDNFDLFLFDLDGTLINSEDIHHNAYNNAFSFFNLNVSLSFEDYCKYSHINDKSMEQFLLSITNEITYDQFYLKKKKFYIELINNDVQLLDGVEDFLNILFSKNKKTCIVTNTNKESLDCIIKKLPILSKINYFITKDDYINKKPDPECYLMALNLFKECKNPIGFEDSYKGYISLKKSNITSVFVNNTNYPLLYLLKPENYISSFADIHNLIIKK
jgi:HAD superfamily hydrolase (TIGR01509 family)